MFDLLQEQLFGKKLYCLFVKLTSLISQELLYLATSHFEPWQHGVC